jgi:hypothetical protein
MRHAVAPPSRHRVLAVASSAWYVAAATMQPNAVHYERVIRAVLLAGAIVAVVVVQLMRRRR